MSVELNSNCATTAATAAATSSATNAAENLRVPRKKCHAFSSSSNNSSIEFKRNSNAYASLPNRSSGLWTDDDDEETVPVERTTATTTTTKQRLRNDVDKLSMGSSSSNSCNSNSDSSLECSTATATTTAGGGDGDVGHSFGLSNSLSSESIKRACDYFDDELSDEDLIEVQNTPQSFNQQKLCGAAIRKHNSHPISFAMEQCMQQNHNSNNTDKHPLCAAMEVENGLQQLDDTVTPDEAMIVLDELDAILDIHGASQLNISGISSSNDDNDDDDDDDGNVEEYLMELDNYLEELDNECTPEVDVKELQRNTRSRTLPLGKKRKHVKSELHAKELETHDDGMEFKRGHDLRKTISCGLDKHATNVINIEQLNAVATDDSWRRRNSMRRAYQPYEAAMEANLDKETTTISGSMHMPEDLLSESSAQTHELVAVPLTLNSSDMRRCFSQDNFTGVATRVAAAGSGSNAVEMLTDAHIFNNLLQNESSRLSSNDLERPRQFGRRAEGHPRIMSIRSELPSGCMFLSQPQQQQQAERRPMSAPAHTAAGYAQRSSTTNPLTPERTRRTADESCSDLSSTHCSRIPSPISVLDSSTDSSSSIAASANDHLEPSANDMHDEHTTIGGNSRLPLDAELTLRLREKCGFNSEWPYAGSRTLALFGCTLGLFNICRFAVLTINYGGNFLLQFLLLSILFGIPLFWLQMCLGAKIKAGPVSMWKISPICSGIGIALVMVQCFIAIYSTVSIAWVLVYLRDTFPVQGRSGYRWQELAYPYRFSVDNSTANLTDTVAGYFNIVVLQRLQFIRRADGSGVRFHVNDRLAFYLALIWAAVFLILCKGLKSLGRIAYILFSVPLLALFVVTAKFVYVVDPAKIENIFSATDLDEFLINSRTWTAATQETFLTWGLLGASVIAITSRSHASVDKRSLRRDAILIVLVTLLGLTLSALLALCCMQILKQNNYIYAPGSYENAESSTSVYSLKAQINTELISYPHNLVPHYSSVVGETYRRPNAITHRESGYQALRFVTELFPAVFSLAEDSISWIWAAIAFSMLAAFGLSQLCVMWKPISSALGNSTSSVLLSCVTGLLLSIPFATEMGIQILYYMDYLIGAAWFIPILWTAQIFGVFLIRGRPYNGDDLVNDLHMSASMSAFLALSWNVLLPIGLVTLSVIDYKASLSNQFYYWRGKSYFSYWTRKVGSLIQIGLLLVVPVTAIIQIYRYLTNGPPDILERIQLLYRPTDENGENRRAAGRNRDLLNRRNTNANGNSGNGDANGQQQIQNDAPPKYTPPPSYTTATGARLAKLLRQSIRRSVRRVLGDSNRPRPTLSIDAESNAQNPPPDYLTILTHAAGGGTQEGRQQQPTISESIEIGQRPISTVNQQRSLTLGRKVFMQKQKQKHFDDLQQQRPSSARATLELRANAQRPYTAEDVVTILRSSVRNRQSRTVGIAPRSAPPAATTTTTMDNQMESGTFRSIENLVLNAEPPDNTPGVGVGVGAATTTEQRHVSSTELNSTSVI